MHLSDLVSFDSDFGIEIPEHSYDPEIKGLTADSRKCGEGYFFAALPGSAIDGANFIDDAIKKGAVVVLIASDVKMDNRADVVFIRHKNPRFILGHIAANFYKKQPKKIAAVTGTNGKTSVVHFCRQIWNRLGHKSASIGTLGVIDKESAVIGENSVLTTPDSIQLHEALASLAENGVDSAAIEASSHGLEQQRIAGVKIKIGAFTNISRDHLDYHKTFENYFNSKMLLFTDVTEDTGIAVLNADIQEFPKISDICLKRGLKVVSYGKHGMDIKLLESTPTETGQNIKIMVSNKEYELTTNLIGTFQASNILCALGIVIASGEDSAKAVEACKTITPVSGRMETVVQHPCGSPILIDYAHTPDALEKILLALRPHVENRLFVVFGCGGDRDKGKRPIMGEIASKLADVAIVTDDNPRTEDANVIRSEIMSRCKNGKEIGDRREAIKYAIKKLEKGDLLVIAGKGHEKYQIVGNEKKHFDDAQEAIQAVKDI